ncbi:MAG: FGGY family carbohydrate kinase, partial [Candidatus Stygibacter australis]|nr:FGGY family carbohydrate kinase [Candidatus Stygibacter australis]
MKKYILAIDQGTSSCRAVLFDESFGVAGIEQKETQTSYPHSGWVEQDAIEIWENQLAVIQALLAKKRVKASEIAGIGITNQRETTVIWDKSGKPV